MTWHDPFCRFLWVCYRVIWARAMTTRKENQWNGRRPVPRQCQTVATTRRRENKTRRRSSNGCTGVSITVSWSSCITLSLSLSLSLTRFSLSTAEKRPWTSISQSGATENTGSRWNRKGSSTTVPVRIRQLKWLSFCLLFLSCVSVSSHELRRQEQTEFNLFNLYSSIIHVPMSVIPSELRWSEWQRFHRSLFQARFLFWVGSIIPSLWANIYERVLEDWASNSAPLKASEPVISLRKRTILLLLWSFLYISLLAVMMTAFLRIAWRVLRQWVRHERSSIQWSDATMTSRTNWLTFVKNRSMC